MMLGQEQNQDEERRGDGGRRRGRGRKRRKKKSRRECTFPVGKEGWKRNELSSITVHNFVQFQIEYYCMD